MVIKYENGKIYKIITNDPNEPCYVGSTTKIYLSQRMAKHVQCYKSWKNGKTGKLMSFEMFDNFGIQNCKIILLESITAKSKDELLRREQYYIDTLNCINKNRAITTHEQKLEQKLKYRKSHKTDIKIARKVFYEANKEKLLAIHKHYRQNQGKDKVKALEEKRSKIKFRCYCCNNEHSMKHKSRHLNSNKHITNTIQYMESLTEKYNQVQPIEIKHFTLE